MKFAYRGDATLRHLNARKEGRRTRRCWLST